MTHLKLILVHSVTFFEVILFFFLVLFFGSIIYPVELFRFNINIEKVSCSPCQSFYGRAHKIYLETSVITLNRFFFN